MPRLTDLLQIQLQHPEGCSEGIFLFSGERSEIMKADELLIQANGFH